MCDSYTLHDWENTHIETGRNGWDTSGQNSHPQHSARSLVRTYSTPAFKAATQLIGPQLTCLLQPVGSAFLNLAGLQQTMKQLLNRWLQEHSPQLFPECRQIRQKRPSPSFSQEGFNVCFTRVLPKDPASNWPASRCCLGSSLKPERATSSLWLTPTIKSISSFTLEGACPHM